MMYYISDLHFGHRRMLMPDGFDRRPFPSLEAMHETLKTRWNDQVANTDDVYILGDLSWRADDAAVAWIAQLQGRKHLVVGNHDILTDVRFRQLFEEIVPYKEVEDHIGGAPYRVVLSHYPLMFWNHQHMERWGGGLQRHWAVHLYGHVHASREEGLYQSFLARLNTVHGIRCVARNVGCMMPWMDYSPRALGEILGAPPLDLAEMLTSIAASRKGGSHGGKSTEVHHFMI